MTRPGDFPTVGIVGAGQLARMCVGPAVELGVRLRVLAVTADDPAAQVVPGTTVGDYRDLATLRAFAAGCDVVTFDHEHVPTAHLEALQADGVTVRPGPDALVHGQDKRVMRERLGRLAGVGVAGPRWAPVAAVEDVEKFVASTADGRAVLKTVRGGYDGHGVAVVDGAGAAAQAAAWLEGGADLLVEELVPFTRELSALVARSPSGQAVAYPVVESLQVDGICREVYAPAPGLHPDHALAAQQAALAVAGDIGLVGVMAVEMFDTPDGVLVNELALRPHNTGHWTIEGAVTGQFEQHLRAVLDLPLGDPTAVAPHAVMVNVLGGDDPAVSDLYPAYLHCMARDPGLKIHVYGKQVRPGRKVGHVTVTGADLTDLQERARHAAAYLRGDVDE